MPRAKHGGYSKKALLLYREALREEKEEEEKRRLYSNKEEENGNGFCSNREDCACCSSNPQCIQGMEERLGRHIEEVPSELGAGCSGQYFVASCPREVPDMLASA